jgi:hypothetical protein
VRSWSWTAVGLLLLVFALCNFAFGSPLMPAGDVDSSYKMVLNDAFARGLVFGRDVVFTFGPLGFLHATMFDPRTYSWIVLFNVAWAGFVAAGLVAAGRASGASPLRVGIVGLVFLFCALEPDAKFYAFCALVTLLAFRASPDRASPLLLAAVALLAVFSLMKFSFLILSAVLLVLIAAARLRRDGRGAVLLLGGWAALVCLAWVAAGQPPAALGDFLRQGFAMAAGYPEAMATPGPVQDVRLAATSAALLAGALVWSETRSSGVRGLFHAAAVAAILAVGLRHGFVRHLSHGLTAVYALSAVTALYAGLAAPGRGRWLGLLGGVAAAIALAMLAARPETADYWRFVRANGPRALVRGAGVAGGWERYRREWRTANARLAGAHPLPPLEGSVDLFTIGQAWVLARGLPLRSRPVFQSYQATSPALAALNARFLGERGARNLVWDHQTIDGRYPTLDDGPAWLEVIRHYDLTRWTGQVAVLERRDAPRPLRLSPLGTTDAGFGERIQVPATTDPVWVRIDLPETLAGRLARTFLKSPEVGIEIALRSGDTEQYRLVPDMGRAGFLLSPLVEWPNAFVEFLSPRWRERLAPWDVVSLRITGGRQARRAFGPRARIEFSALEFRHQATLDAEAAGDVGRPLDLGTHALADEASVRRDGTGLAIEARGTDPRVVLGALAPSRRGERPAFLTFDVEQPHAGTFQVFLRPWGEEFSEDGSARFQLSAGRHRVRVPLPESRHLVEVRVDPGTRPGTYRLLGASIAPATGDLSLGPQPLAEARGPYFLASVPGREAELAYVPAVGLDAFGEDALPPAVGPEALFPAPRPVADVRLVPDGGTLELVATGRDPRVLLGRIPPSPPGEVRLLRLAVESFTPDILQMYWRRRGDDDFSERRSRLFPLLPGRHLLQVPVVQDPEAVEFRLDPGTRPGRVVLLGAGVSGATTEGALPSAAGPGTRGASAARRSAGSAAEDPRHPARAAR